MPFDFKKEFKEFYMPKNEPETVAIMDKYIEENCAYGCKYFILEKNS